MVDFIDKEKISSLPRILESNGNDRVAMAMETILERAQERGEISLNKINLRIILLPMDLIRYEIFFRHKPISDITLMKLWTRFSCHLPVYESIQGSYY